MKLEVLHVQDCPNLQPMLDRLAAASNLPVATRIIDTAAEAERFGLAGSPTLLIDGIDPFAAPGQRKYGVSCRLYRDNHGQPVAAPSVEQLRDAIRTTREPTASNARLSVRPTRGLPLDP